MHRPQPRVEIAPASIAVERHRQAAIRSLDTNHARIARARSFYGVGLHHVIVLLPYPALAADIRAGQKAFETVRQITGTIELNILRHFARHWRLPTRQWTLVHRSIVGERWIGNLCDNFSVLTNAQLVIAGDDTHFDRIKAPFFENAEDLLLAAFLRYEQHALLRFAEHDFISAHAGFALGHPIQFDLNADATTAAHFAGRTREPGSAHVLNANNRAGLHGFETRFQQ